MKEEMELIEQEFLKLKERSSQKDWNDPKSLRDKAISYEKSNLPLAYRLMQRAHTLKPSGPVLNKKLKEYRVKLESNFPEFLSYTSNSKTTLVKEVVANKVYDYSFFTWKLIKRPIGLFVFLPIFIFFMYQNFIASERFESTALLIVKQPDALSTMSPELALLSGVSGTNDPDAALVESYIHSIDLIDYLESTLSLREHYSSNAIDRFSRLNPQASIEEFISYYQKHVSVQLVPEGGIIIVAVQSFSPQFTQLLNKTIVNRTEWFINEIGHKLAKEQLSFIGNEHEIASNNLKTAQSELLNFQQKHNLLDPESEGVAIQSITFGLEKEIASKNAELKAFQSIMSNNSSEIRQTQNQLLALKQQLKLERERLSAQEYSGASVSQVVSKFSELKINFEMAMQAYSSSLISIEKSRIEAYRQLKYLVTIQKPMLPEDNKYPEVWYNTTLFTVVLFLFYGITRIIIATIQELA